MDVTSIEHCLTENERQHFDNQGYLIVENALNKQAQARLCEAVDKIDREERRNKDLDPNMLQSLTDVVRRDPAFIDLLTWPTVFPKVWGVLGWNIYLYHAHSDVTPPVEQERRVSQHNYRSLAPGQYAR